VAAHDRSEPNPHAVAQFDLAHPPVGFIDDPYPWYSALRDYDPIHRCPDGSRLLTRHADCLAVYRHSDVSSDKRNLFGPKFGASPLFEHHTTSLVFNDPPYHTRVRATLAEALKPRTIEPTVAALERVVSRLLDELEARREVDLIEHYASRVPVEIICTLLTVPPEDRDHLRRWSLAILGALEPELTPEQRADGDRAVTEFVGYLRDLIAHRRAHPAHAPNDVLATLTSLYGRGELSEAELVHNCIFLLNAGHETTTNLIGNGVHCLLTHPDAAAGLRARPHLIKSAVEEVLRFASPNQLGNREVARRLQIGAVQFEPGEQITLAIGAANRDPAQFSDPDRFDVARSPNHHLAFASGIHACVGMALARIEGKVAIGALLERFGTIELLRSPPVRQRMRFRGLERLDVSVAR
jgi:cytochrome P450